MKAVCPEVAVYTYVADNSGPTAESTIPRIAALSTLDKVSILTEALSIVAFLPSCPSSNALVVAISFSYPTKNPENVFQVAPELKP